MTAIIHQGEALRILQTLPDASVDGVITDPPYSSCGDRIQAAQGLHVAQQDGLFEVAA